MTVSGPQFVSGTYAVWSAALAGGVVALRLLLANSTAQRRPSTQRNPSAQRSQVGTAELASLGLGPSRIGLLTSLATLLGAVAVAFYVWQQKQGPGTHSPGTHSPDTYSPGTQILAEAAAWVLLAVVLITSLLPRVLRFVVGQRYVRRRDAAALLWMRRIRMHVANGLPINAAALDAAEQVAEPAFKPMAGAINLAVTTGHDPLAAAASKLHGSEAAALLGTVNAAERSGAGASELIDKVLQRVLRSLDAQRRERIDRLARMGATTSSLTTILAGGVVVLMVVSTLPAI